MPLQRPLTARGCLPGPALPSLLPCQASWPAWSSGLYGCCEERQDVFAFGYHMLFKRRWQFLPLNSQGCFPPTGVSGLCDFGGSMEPRSWPSARNFDPLAATFLGRFMLANLALRWAKSFPSRGRWDGHVRYNMEVPIAGTSGSISRTQHLVHLHDVLLSGQSTSSVRVSGSPCAAVPWLNCELNFNGSDESGSVSHCLSNGCYLDPFSSFPTLCV